MEKFKSDHKVLYYLFIFPIILFIKGILLYFKILCIVLITPFIILAYAFCGELGKAISGGKRCRTRNKIFVI